MACDNGLRSNKRQPIIGNSVVQGYWYMRHLARCQKGYIIIYNVLQMRKIRLGGHTALPSQTLDVHKKLVVFCSFEFPHRFGMNYSSTSVNWANFVCSHWYCAPNLAHIRDVGSCRDRWKSCRQNEISQGSKGLRCAQYIISYFMLCICSLRVGAQNNHNSQRKPSTSYYKGLSNHFSV